MLCSHIFKRAAPHAGPMPGHTTPRSVPGAENELASHIPYTCIRVPSHTPWRFTHSDEPRSLTHVRTHARAYPPMRLYGRRDVGLTYTLMTTDLTCARGLTGT